MTEEISSSEEDINSKILITPEVEVNNGEVLYLVKRNGVEVCFSASQQDALLVVDSIASAEQRNLEMEGVIRSYREDQQGGQRIIISTQELGIFFDGRVHETVVIEFLSVAVGMTNKFRLALTESFIGL